MQGNIIFNHILYTNWIQLGFLFCFNNCLDWEKRSLFISSSFITVSTAVLIRVMPIAKSIKLKFSTPQFHSLGPKDFTK